MFRVHGYMLNGPNDHRLLVQWCGYTKDQATWEPYAKVWTPRHELLQDYFHKHGRGLPLDLEAHVSDTSDEEEPQEIEIKVENDD
ncbi:hypothetical protein FVEN_g12609 [Fusarium venenatum]|uniref:Chromo domain-containing protein n=1 Tax=Fusarium venenatum TaxID=56646 RepID=A0A2L2TR24_9HYPO|nr:uncharacterized protein FVRRES_07776 [Fusarium venenatum]KAG8362451.1 hypothetical protein FVEN_g12609 [Fusarium venenatum]CEI63340.1 unnamed protein product [Fusarium venenatum]